MHRRRRADPIVDVRRRRDASERLHPLRRGHPVRIRKVDDARAPFTILHPVQLHQELREVLLPHLLRPPLAHGVFHQISEGFHERRGPRRGELHELDLVVVMRVFILEPEDLARGGPRLDAGHRVMHELLADVPAVDELEAEVANDKAQEPVVVAALVGPRLVRQRGDEEQVRLVGYLRGRRVPLTHGRGAIRVVVHLWAARRGSHGPSPLATVTSGSL